MDTSALEDLGLTKAEISIYIALLELGESTAGPIIKRTKLQNSVVHMTLGKLCEKGLGSFIRKGKIKHYRAASPESVLKFVDEKRRNIEKILPELRLRAEPVRKLGAEVYTGFKGFLSLQTEFISDGIPGDEYLFTSFTPDNAEKHEKYFQYYKEFEEERKAKGFIVKGIAPSFLREKFIGRDISNIAFVDFPTPWSISIFRDKVAFVPMDDEEDNFLIYSKSMAKSLRKYFYSIWNQYEKG